MPARGIEVSQEAIRLWTLRFGTEYARRLRCTRGKCSNIWHLDELCLMINGERGWLWRAVDDAGKFSTSWCNAVGARSPRNASFANS
jgi:putative transposase